MSKKLEIKSQFKNYPETIDFETMFYITTNCRNVKLLEDAIERYGDIFINDYKVSKYVNLGISKKLILKIVKQTKDFYKLNVDIHDNPDKEFVNEILSFCKKIKYRATIKFNIFMKLFKFVTILRQ